MENIQIRRHDRNPNLWWVSSQGVRYGISSDTETLRALGLDPGSAVQAPWPILRMFAAGPVLSKKQAMALHDTVSGGGQVAPLPKPAGS